MPSLIAAITPDLFRARSMRPGVPDATASLRARRLTPGEGGAARIAAAATGRADPDDAVAPAAILC